MSANPPSRKSSKPIVLKVLTAGEGGVGKTTLLHRYIEGKFIEGMKMTIGVEFFLKKFQVQEKKIALQIWDFGGQDRFRFFLQSYARGADGALLLCDLTRPLSLSRLGEWVDICRSENKQLPILFLGAKLDLEEDISVDDAYLREKQEELDLFDFMKISSKTGHNVENAFETLTRRMLKEKKII